METGRLQSLPRHSLPTLERKAGSRIPPDGTVPRDDEPKSRIRNEPNSVFVFNRSSKRKPNFKPVEVAPSTRRYATKCNNIGLAVRAGCGRIPPDGTVPRDDEPKSRIRNETAWSACRPPMGMKMDCGAAQPVVPNRVADAHGRAFPRNGCFGPFAGIVFSSSCGHLIFGRTQFGLCFQ